IGIVFEGGDESNLGTKRGTNSLDFLFIKMIRLWRSAADCGLRTYLQFIQHIPHPIHLLIDLPSF
ncbi:MAG TPA: hypothetical protein VEV87_03130, partial [Chitinophagaceae bacterium]|nr:hypothetical protein [Chitinophagaceae bacterium]